MRYWPSICIKRLCILSALREDVYKTTGIVGGKRKYLLPTYSSFPKSFSSTQRKALSSVQHLVYHLHVFSVSASPNVVFRSQITKTMQIGKKRSLASFEQYKTCFIGDKIYLLYNFLKYYAGKKKECAFETDDYPL